MVYVDSNILVISLMDLSQRGDAARGIMRLIENGSFEAITSALTLDEVMWTFIKSGRKDRLTDAISGFYETGLRIVPVSSQAPLKACGIIDECGLDPRDAIHAAVMRENHVTEILSEDKHFDKVGWIKRYSIEGFIKKFG